MLQQPRSDQPVPHVVTRREVLRALVHTALGAVLAPLLAACAPGTQNVAATQTRPTPPRGSTMPTSAPSPTTMPPPFVLEETTLSDIQMALRSGQLTARQLVSAYLARIEALDRAGPHLRSIIETNPEALAIAAALDEEFNRSGPRGPLHGVPVLLKDNIDTADALHTTGGSLALLGTRPTEDATVARKLRAAGAIILGKANLSEWANFRSTKSSSGWSARGGQGLNPYVLDRNPCGSSSGSAAAVAANLAAVALGTETDGSIVCPAHANGIVGLKPTVGLTSRAGVIPIAHSQDSVGPMTRTVRDAAILLGIIAGRDERDSATTVADAPVHHDYTPFLDAEGLRGARLGVLRQEFVGYSAEADLLFEQALTILRAQGATLVDPAEMPSGDKLQQDESEFAVLLYEFKADLAAYLSTRVPDERHPDLPVMRSLDDVMQFNREHRQEEQPYFGQEIFALAQSKGPLSEPAYEEALATSQRLGRQEGIDAVMEAHRLDALVALTGGPAWVIDLEHGDHGLGGSASPAARAGYPLISVPAGWVGELPIGLTFMGRAWSEGTLLKFAYAFEQASQARRPPRFLPTQP